MGQRSGHCSEAQVMRQRLATHQGPFPSWQVALRHGRPLTCHWREFAARPRLLPCSAFPAKKAASIGLGE